ncbi:MAG: calcineurin-like phosphoesterase family protein [Tannerellaceae bacterium]|jgi:hypothetical protein|nr:calcineurin-like phosphoesterase family protein [Tannerellaceae bacterium]
MKQIAVLIVLLFLAGTVAAEEFVTGFVFDDVNRNGKKEKAEKGIPQVAVSNGKDVVLTDMSGKYKLPIGADNIIFVIKPTGYKTATDEFNIPKFFYIHKPAGSPELKYKGVEPTGKLPKSLDFALQKYDEPDAFTALIFGDTQPYNETEIDYLTRGIIAEAAETAKEAMFGITLGDLVGNNLSLHLPYKHAIKKVGIPWYNVMGNHDRNYDTDEDRLSDEAFEAAFGPNNYSFNYGMVHFVVLDDIFSLSKGGKYTGGLRSDQLEFLANDLKHVSPSQLLVIALHIPLTGIEAGAFREDERKKIYALVKDYPRVLVLSAHMHFQCQSFAGNIHEYNVGATCGDWFSGTMDKNNLPLSIMCDGTPPGYAFLRIAGNNYALNYKVFDKPTEYRMSIYSPKVVRAKASTTANIYANIFMASERDVVEYRIDNGEWSKMQLTKEFDPAYYRYVQDWDYLDELVPGRRPSNPEICRHLYKARLTTNLPIGEHRIEVRTKDMFGQTYSQQSLYRVE